MGYSGKGARGGGSRKGAGCGKGKGKAITASVEASRPETPSLDDSEPDPRFSEGSESYPTLQALIDARIAVELNHMRSNKSTQHAQGRLL